VLLARGDALLRAGEPDAARAAFTAARTLALRRRDDALLAEAALGFSGLGIAIVDLDAPAIARLEEALERVEDSALRSRLQARLAVELYYAPDRTRSEALSAGAVATARDSGDASALASALGARHVALWRPDRVEQRLAVAADDPLELRLTTQGLPLPGMRMRAVDPATDRPLPPNEVGELRVNGWVMPGYYRDAEQTRAAFDADGFFRTGDLGMLGADGRVRFRGRLKELIKTGGINVAPLEVEAVLLSHPAVKQAYVVGLTDRGKGEIAAAAIELHAGATASVETLTAFCRERLASYKVPARIVFRKAEEFPRTATGKVQKPRLRDELEGLCAP
jgi:fatty-acyl-CoA synthase